jgi:16S rRNA (guanine966-N2)-methyltransferase
VPRPHKPKKPDDSPDAERPGRRSRRAAEVDSTAPAEADRPAARRAEPDGVDERIAATLRIIGGKFGRRRLKYTGDPRTRPMKDRVREALFNLVGPSVIGSHAIDLFAGTGALGLEALSRGAARATFIERHYPTADTIKENVASLDVGEISRVTTGDTFLFVRKLPDMGPEPWVVFCSPPYDLYVDRADDVRLMIERLMAAAPAGSTFVIESDQRFEIESLPTAGREVEWDVRNYPPARVGIGRFQESST